LRRKEKLPQKEYDELEKAYSFMMQLRFVRQIKAIVEEKSKPDNYINPKDLTRIEQKMLKEIFLRVGQFQSKLDFEFIGMV
jgi:CBS domain-containing protein